MINTVKMAIILKAIYIVKTISMSIQTQIFTVLEMTMFSFGWKHYKPKKTTILVTKKRTAGDITIPKLNLDYITIILKTAWSGKKNRYTNQWYQSEDTNISPHTYR